MQLLVVDQLEGQFVRLYACVFGEGYLSGLVVNCGVDCITFAKFYAFYCVVLVSFVVGPTASVGADHVSSMTYRSKFEWIHLTFNCLPVTKTNSKPIAFGFPNTKAESFSSYFIHPWFHCCKFISLTFDRLDSLLSDQFDLIVFVFLGKSIGCLP